MMKKVLGLTLGLTAMAMAAMAAPVTYVPEGGTHVGYGYNGARDGSHALYAEHSVVDQVVLGVEYRKLIHEGNELDIYGKYRLNNNIYVTIGNRDIDQVGNKFYAGIEGMTYLSDKFDGYASFKYSSAEKEYKVGALYDLNPQFDLDVNYTYQDRDETVDRKGVGVGLNYRF